MRAKMPYFLTVQRCRCDALRHSTNFQPIRAKMPYFLNIALTYLFQVSPDNLKHKFNDYASKISRTEINVDLLHR